LINRRNADGEGAGPDSYTLRDRELAEIRYQIRCFQSQTEENAASLGIAPDTYLLLLAVQGLPEGVPPTVRGLAGRMCLSPERISELFNSAAAVGNITRSSSEGAEDWVKLTRHGRDALRRMALVNRDELERSGPELVRSLQSILKHRRRRNRVA